MELHCETHSPHARDFRKSIQNKIESSTELKDLAEKNSIKIKTRGKVFFKKEYNFQVIEEPVKNRTETLRRAFNEFEPIGEKLNEILQGIS